MNDKLKDEITKAIHGEISQYVEEYELRSDEGDYSPTRKELLLIEDALRGYLDNLDVKILALIGQGKEKDE